MPDLRCHVDFRTSRAGQPYGTTRTSTAGLTTDRRYLHAPNDEQTGLVQLGARYYDPSLAKFISPDPLLLPENPKTLNPYISALNKPMTYTDPTGLYPIEGGGDEPWGPPPGYGGDNGGSAYRPPSDGGDYVIGKPVFEPPNHEVNLSDIRRCPRCPFFLASVFEEMLEPIRCGAGYIELTCGGPGTWRQENEGAVNRLNFTYQSWVVGVPEGWVYDVNGHKFDGYDPRLNELLDAKGNYDHLIKADLTPEPFIAANWLAIAEKQTVAVCTRLFTLMPDRMIRATIPSCPLNCDGRENRAPLGTRLIAGGQDMA